MFKVIRVMDRAEAELTLNKLNEGDKQWRVVGCSDTYMVLTDEKRTQARRVERVEPDVIAMKREHYQRIYREVADREAEVADLRKRLASYEDEASAKHWDSLRLERDIHQRNANNLFEALLWASAASDFFPGDMNVPPGKAKDGWLSGPRKAIEQYQADREMLAEANRER